MTATNKNKPAKATKSVLISDRDRLIIDNYLETYNKSRSVLEVIPELKHQSQANHVFTSIWKKPEVIDYVRERRSYLASERPGLTVYEIAQELQNMIMSDITEVATCTSLEEVKELPPSTRRLIQDIKIQERTETDRKGNEIKVKDIQFKFVNKLDALKEYNKLTGNYLIDNTQKNKGIDLSKLPIEMQLQLLKILENQDKTTTIDI
jgi:hypothetical protein